MRAAELKKNGTHWQTSDAVIYFLPKQTDIKSLDLCVARALEPAESEEVCAEA